MNKLRGGKMKKIILWCFVVFSTLLLAGCGKGNKDVVKDLNNKINKSKSYYITGELEIIKIKAN